MARRLTPVLQQPARLKIKAVLLVITILFIINGCSSGSNEEVVIDDEKSVFPFPDALSATAIDINATNLSVELRFTDTTSNEVFVRVIKAETVDDTLGVITGPAPEPMPIGSYNLDISYILNDPDFGNVSIVSFPTRPFTISRGTNVATVIGELADYVDSDFDGFSSLKELEAEPKSNPSQSFSIPVAGKEFAPPVKVKVKVTDTGVNQGRFFTFWETVPGVDFYGVHMNQSPGPLVTDAMMHHTSNIGQNEAEVTGFGHTDLAYGTPWYIVVVSQRSNDAQAGDGNSSFESVEVFVRSKADDPNIPKNITIESGIGQNTISWDPPDNGATAYNVYYSSTPGVTKGEVGEVVGADLTETSFVHSGLDNLQMYYYAVTALGANESAESAEVGATPYGPLAAPSVTNDETVSGTVKLDWSTVPGAQSYIIYMASNSGVTPDRQERGLLDGGMQHPVTGNTFTHSPLIVGNTYYFRIAAVDKFGRIGLLSDELAAVVHE